MNPLENSVCEPFGESGLGTATAMSATQSGNIALGRSCERASHVPANQSATSKPNEISFGSQAKYVGSSSRYGLSLADVLHNPLPINQSPMFTIIITSVFCVCRCRVVFPSLFSCLSPAPAPTTQFQANRHDSKNRRGNHKHSAIMFYRLDG